MTLKDLVLKRIAHVKHISLVHVRRELEQGSSDLFKDVLRQSELATLTNKFIEDFFVLFDLRLRGENLKTNNLVTDGSFKLFAFLFTVNDLSKLISLFLEQIVDESVIELFLEILQLGALVAKIILLFGLLLVKLKILSVLLEEFKNILGSLELHSAKEEGPNQLVGQLNVARILTHEEEAISIFFKSFASLQEENESLEGALFHLEAILNQILHDVTEKHGVFLVNSNESDQIDQVALHVFRLIIQDEILNDLFIVLFLGLQSNRLK